MQKTVNGSVPPQKDKRGVAIGGKHNQNHQPVKTQNTHNMHSHSQPVKNNIAPCTQVKTNPSTHF